jgi:hypothetical protein
VKSESSPEKCKEHRPFIVNESVLISVSIRFDLAWDGESKRLFAVGQGNEK